MNKRPWYFVTSSRGPWLSEKQLAEKLHNFEATWPLTDASLREAAAGLHVSVADLHCKLKLNTTSLEGTEVSRLSLHLRQAYFSACFQICISYLWLLTSVRGLILRGVIG